MAQKWYPVIDSALCGECGACVTKFSHGVYDSAKSPSAVVSNPVECVDHCHGCGNICPTGAITYVGEDTGWTPPFKAQK
jgi:NAD-dependent dihydropyrimidine dehydrogenase PreA subunit